MIFERGAMFEQARESNTAGFTVLDGAALVAGAAVASAQLRGAFRDDPPGIGLVFLGGTFLWIALTSAGPFLYLVRRFARHLPGYPRVGDRLWAILGVPWLATVAIPSTIHRPGFPDSDMNLKAAGLSLSLAIASLIALAVVWTTWVIVTPDRARETFSPPWTNRVGLILAIAWPVQCGVGMVVIG